MKKKIISIKSTVQAFPKQYVVTLNLDNQTLPDLTLMLTLLKEDLVNSIELKLTDIKIEMIRTSKKYSECILNNEKERFLKVAISESALEYVLSFLMKYYRDDTAEAEHIDVDFKYLADSELTLTIKADTFREISPEEMNKLLDL